MVRKMLIGAVLLVALAAAPAAAQYDTVTVSPGTITPGGSVTVTGQACLPNVTVQIYLVPGPGSKGMMKAVKVAPGAILVATTTADGQGKFSVTFTVPANLAPGQYHIEVTAPHPDQLPVGCFTSVEGAGITIAPVSTTTPGGTGTGTGGGTGGGNLSHTGSDLDRMGMIGAGLLVAGGLVLVATKRRRHEAQPAV